MKKLLRSAVGRLAVASFLAVVAPMYARGGNGGGHGGQRGGNGGDGVKHAAAGHVKGGLGAFRPRGGRGRQFVGPARGRARYAGRGYYRTGGRWGGWGGYGYPYYGSSNYRLGYYGLGYRYPYYGY